MLMEGAGQSYELYQQPNQIQQWQEQERQRWIMQQQQQQRWIQQQENLRRMQQQQRYVQPHPNSTPMFYPAVPAQRQRQIEQDGRRTYEGRQQLLRQWGMPGY